MLEDGFVPGISICVCEKPLSNFPRTTWGHEIIDHSKIGAGSWTIRGRTF